jgi:CelD/BcsL family acetyltransferase involved in cellulose biosynthesis
MTPKRLGFKMPNSLYPTYTVTEESLTSLADLWSDPSQRLDWDCLFVLPAWLNAWWRCFGKEMTPFLRSVRNRNVVIGIAPLMISGQTAFFMGDAAICDYLDFVVAPGEEAAFFPALVRDLRGQGVAHLVLDAVRADSAVIRVLADMAAHLDFRFSAAPQDVAMVVDLPKNWDAYLQHLRGKDRHEIRRKFRRLREAVAPDLRIAEKPVEVAKAMDTFLRLFKKNRSDKAAFMTPDMSTFFQMMAEALVEIDIFKLFTVGIESEPAAAVICFDYRSCRHLYNNAYNELFAALSVGYLSKVLSIRDAIESGLRTYDFLKGAEAYKQRLGGRPLPLYRCRVALN